MSVAKRMIEEQLEENGRQEGEERGGYGDAPTTADLADIRAGRTANRERAKIVAWLRDEATRQKYDEYAQALMIAADGIEAGEHLEGAEVIPPKETSPPVIDKNARRRAIDAIMERDWIDMGFEEEVVDAVLAAYLGVCYA